MNGLWRYMLGEIAKSKAPSPSEGTELDEETKEAYNAKLLPWLTVTDSLRGVIRSTCTLDPMSHVSNLELCSEMWAKFELLYRDTGFMERDAILIRLSNKTASDFDDVAHFADSLKRDSTRLKEIGKGRSRLDVHHLASKWPFLGIRLLSNDAYQQPESKPSQRREDRR